MKTTVALLALSIAVSISAESGRGGGPRGGAPRGGGPKSMGGTVRVPGAPPVSAPGLTFSRPETTFSRPGVMSAPGFLVSPHLPAGFARSGFPGFESHRRDGHPIFDRDHKFSGQHWIERYKDDYVRAAHHHALLAHHYAQLLHRYVYFPHDRQFLARRFPFLDGFAHVFPDFAGGYSPIYDYRYLAPQYFYMFPPGELPSGYEWPGDSAPGERPDWVLKPGYPEMAAAEPVVIDFPPGSRIRGAKAEQTSAPGPNPKSERPQPKQTTALLE
jgi:hypothetical protein